MYKKNQQKLERINKKAEAKNTQQNYQIELLIKVCYIYYSNILVFIGV